MQESRCSLQAASEVYSSTDRKDAALAKKGEKRLLFVLANHVMLIFFRYIMLDF